MDTRAQKFFLNDDKPASLAIVDPMAKLGCAAIVQAVKDLHGRDPLKALDALVWLATDGYIWLDSLSFYVQPGELLIKASCGRAQ